MKKIISKLIFFALGIIVISGVYTALFAGKKQVKAQRFFIKDDGLYSISETLGEKKFIDDPEIKILFSRYNGKILFGKGWTGDTPPAGTGSTTLWIADETTANIQQLTPNPDVIYAFFAQDGRIFYSTKNQDLFVINSIENPASKRIQEKILSPDISPDGRYLIYQKLNSDWEIGQYYDKALGLTILDLLSNEEKRISDSWEDFNPLWTLDGTQIIFFSRSPQGLASFFVMSPDGSNRKQLTNIGKKFVDDTTIATPSEKPIWSSDGKYLIYESDRIIWVLEFSKDYRKIISAKRVAYGRDPEWSIDGKTFTVVVTTRENSTVTIMEFDVEGNYKKTL